MRQSSSSVKFLYPCAFTRAKAARTAQSMAASRVLPRPQPNSVPPTRVEKTKGFSGVTPVFQRTYAASNMRCAFVYRTKAAMDAYDFSARYFLTRYVSPVSGLGFLASCCWLRTLLFLFLRPIFQCEMLLETG